MRVYVREGRVSIQILVIHTCIMPYKLPRVNQALQPGLDSAGHHCEDVKGVRVCECEHNNPDSLDARLFPSVLAVAPALTLDKASSVGERLFCCQELKVPCSY